MSTGAVNNAKNILLVTANHDDTKRIDYYHLDKENQKITNILINEHSFRDFFANKAGNVIIGAKLNRDNTSTLYSKNNNSWNKLITSNVGETLKILDVNEITNMAYISADIEGRDKKELLLLDMATGKTTTHHSDPKNESDLQSVVFNKAGQPLIASYYGGRLRNYPLNEDVKQTLNKIYAHFEDDVDITVNKIDQGKGIWDISVAYAKQRTRNFVYQVEQDTYVDLLNQVPKISPTLLGERKSVYYQAKDGVTIQAYLTLPKVH